MGLALAAIAAAVVFALVACGGDDEGDQASGGGGGGTVSVLSLWGGSEKEAFEKVLDKFTADDRHHRDLPGQTERDFCAVLRSRSRAATPPNMAIVPGLGIVGSWRATDRDQTIDAI